MSEHDEWKKLVGPHHPGDKAASAIPTQRAIVLTFDDDGNVAMQATPEVTVADYIMGAFNLTRHAGRVLDENRSPIALPTLGARVQPT